MDVILGAVVGTVIGAIFGCLRGVVRARQELHMAYAQALAEREHAIMELRDRLEQVREVQDDDLRAHFEHHPPQVQA